jgi:DNA polymerase elongation subunit (family B)
MNIFDNKLYFAFEIVPKWNKESMKFPNSEYDEIESIYIISSKLYSEFGKCLTFLLTTNANNKDKDNIINLKNFNSEKELLLEFSYLIRYLNPEIIIGYNICGFDYAYIENRAKIYDNNFKNEFMKLSKNNNSSKYEEYILSSTELGYSTNHFYKMNGRIIIDVLQYVLSIYNLKCYKLPYIVKNILNIEYNEKNIIESLKNTIQIFEKTFLCNFNDLEITIINGKPVKFHTNNKINIIEQIIINTDKICIDL